eukprot:1154103-Pelagomonas_calceolata.AAC.2
MRERVGTAASKLRSALAGARINAIIEDDPELLFFGSKLDHGERNCGHACWFMIFRCVKELSMVNGRQIRSRMVSGALEGEEKLRTQWHTFVKEEKKYYVGRGKSPYIN